MILIKSTLTIFICLYVRFNLFLNLQFLLRFLVSLKKLYFCVFNSINTIVADIEGNIRIYRLPSGRGTDHEIYISLASALAISFSLVRTTILGQSVYPDIALHISNYYINS